MMPLRKQNVPDKDGNAFIKMYIIEILLSYFQIYNEKMSKKKIINAALFLAATSQ